MTPHTPLLLPSRPLPVPVRPYQDETTRSFVGRISTANALRASELLKELRQACRPWVHSLAAWTATDPIVLLLAMPQLAQNLSVPFLRRKLTGRPTRTAHAPACHHCTLAKGTSPYVEVYTTHERVICPNHALWIGDGARSAADQISVRTCPEILAAWHHHKNLITQHGRSQVRKAFHVASVVNWAWYDQFQHFTAAVDIYDSLTAVHPRQTNSKAVVAAALYPSIVTLTAAIASPHWAAMAHSTRIDAFCGRMVL